MSKITKIEVEGFKSLKDIIVNLSNINVLIGANGAGKSNFISIFRLLNFLTSEKLQLYIGQSGGGNALLYYGSQVTTQMRVQIHFETENDSYGYFWELSNAAPDTLVFSEENLYFNRNTNKKSFDIALGAGHKESRLNEIEKGEENKDYQKLRLSLQRCQVFHFHDTSDSALIRKSCLITDYKYLRGNARNLAAFLFMLKQSKPSYYKNIVNTIRLAAPNFDDFDLSPDEINHNIVMLNWREKGIDYMFGPHQISDGLLRFMALTTLLNQPSHLLPNVIIIDEPELGLHPYAITLLAAMLKKASNYCQVIIATQSVDIVDQFETEDIVVVERSHGTSSFKRLNSTDLNEWLDDYSLSELWKKNVIGGRPSK